jgi:hypothetical protein
MADEDIRMEVDPNQLKALIAEVKEFDPKLATALRKQLRQIGGTIVDAMQAEVRKAPPGGGSRSTGSHRTRQQIAEGLGVQVATGKKRQGVFITGSSKAMAEGRKSMPRAYNKATFRHPVFKSNRRRISVVRWVNQRGNPYFGGTIKKYEPDAEKAVMDALTEALETVRTGHVT